MDGTEWKIGSFELHVLVLAAQVKSVAIPVYFKVYEHKGVLSENERINFIRKAFIIIDLQDKMLIVDREFIDKEWFTNLVDFGLNFAIRLPIEIKVSGKAGETLKANNDLINAFRALSLTGINLSNFYQLNYEEY